MMKALLPWLLAAAYVICPYDVLPDFLVGPGWMDDLVVLGLAYWWARRVRQMQPNPSRPSSGTGPEGNRDTRASADDPYEVLGLRRGASAEQIRAAYLRLAAQYHPDKVQHLGKEFQDLAHEKFTAIQRAYERLGGA
ncbi:MAG: DnaJ domain-containing protein [Deltaproteobacteria bacterium]|nr:DnaJ domain-containing protein [Deltaproteobacteria bacterium]